MSNDWKSKYDKAMAGWQSAQLFSAKEIGSIVQRQDGYDYSSFELPGKARLDLGYTFVLSGEYIDIPRQVFEIGMD